MKVKSFVFKIFSIVNSFILLLSVFGCSVGQKKDSSKSAVVQGYDAQIVINTETGKKKISPYIYGANCNREGDEPDYLVTAIRQGGNRFTGYNWETNYSNAGRDWQHYSDAYLVNFKKDALQVSGYPALTMARNCHDLGIDYVVTTLQMAGYVAADSNNEVFENEIAPSNRWKEVKAKKNTEFSLTPDKDDDCVYMDEFVNYLVSTLGDARSKTGIQGYSLDNEPSIWSGTHSRLHPEKTTIEELINKTIEYSSAVKDVDPYAEIFAGAFFGFYAYHSLAAAPDWETTYSKQGYDWFLSCFLDKLKQAENNSGRRLVDVLDLHYYSEARGEDRVTECNDPTHTSCIEARLQAPRTLFDDSYTEDSWIGKWYKKYLPILPHVEKSIQDYYPDMKLSFSEYSFGGGNHVSGAIAEADLLGLFATYGVYLASSWAVSKDESYIHSAIELYTNYDGKGSGFGDTLVYSGFDDLTKGSVYASTYTNQNGKLSVILMNKSLTESQRAHININSKKTYSKSKIYGITSSSPEIKEMGQAKNILANSFLATLPPLSVVEIIFN